MFEKIREHTYHTCCYFTDVPYPFGFCRECWILHGRPRAMNKPDDVPERDR